LFLLLLFFFCRFGTFFFFFFFFGQKVSESTSSAQSEEHHSTDAQDKTAGNTTAEFQVLVRSLTGRTYTVTVAESFTVKMLKERVQDQTGIPLDQQRILFEGRQLSSKVTLGSAGVKRDSILHLVLRLRDPASEDDEIAPTTAASHPTVKLSVKRRDAASGGGSTIEKGDEGTAVKTVRFLVNYIRIMNLIVGALAIAMLVIGALALQDGADVFECAYDEYIGLALWLVVWASFLIGSCVLVSMCALFNRERQTAYALAAPDERANRYPELAIMQRINNCIGCFMCAWMIVGIVILASVAPSCMETFEPLWALSVVALALVGLFCCLACCGVMVIACMLQRGTTDDE
jgi:hypothetical protein